MENKSVQKKIVDINVSTGVATVTADQASEWGKYRECKSMEEFRAVRGKNLTRRNI